MGGGARLCQITSCPTSAPDAPFSFAALSFMIWKSTDASFGPPRGRNGLNCAAAGPAKNGHCNGREQGREQVGGLQRHNVLHAFRPDPPELIGNCEPCQHPVITAQDYAAAAQPAALS